MNHASRSTADPVSRANHVRLAVRQASDEVEKIRALPEDLLSELHAARLFRLCLPDALGGDEVDPVTLAKVTEIIAAEDASTAWCIGQATGCAMSAAFLDPGPAQDIFGPDNAVLAWGAGLQGKAVVVDGGYRVSGKWAFASGSRHATWLGGHSYVFNEDGSPLLGDGGQQVNRTVLFPRDRAAIDDNWNVVGLRGTGSDSYAIEDLFVPAEQSLDRENLAELRVDAPIYHVSTTLVYASAFAGVMLGISRGMLGDLIALAAHKTPRGSVSSLRDSQMFHGQLADLEARHRAARAYIHITFGEVWDDVVAGREVTLDQRAAMRLATTHVINQGADIANMAYRLAGQHAVFESRTFERRLRDANAASQQLQGRQTHYATVGRVLLGLEPDTDTFM